MDEARKRSISECQNPSVAPGNNKLNKRKSSVIWDVILPQIYK